MPDMPRTKFNSPWTVENIETELNGTKNARGALTMTEKLAQKVETSTYATDKAAIDAALAEVENKGAKNLLNIGASEFNEYTSQNVKYTNNHDGTVSVNGTSTAANSYINLFTAVSDKIYGAKAGDTIVILSNSDTVALSIVPQVSGTYGSTLRGYKSNPLVYTVPENFTGYVLRLSVALSGTEIQNETVQGMICTKSEWDISQKIAPYAPTNRELYEMILALQSGTRSLFMQPETLTNGEEPETGSREEER